MTEDKAMPNSNAPSTAAKPEQVAGESQQDPNSRAADRRVPQSPGRTPLFRS